MKIIAVCSAIASFAIASSAFAAPVTMTFKNLSTTTVMRVGTVNACGVLSPLPADVLAGATSPASTTDCGGATSVSHVTYTMGSKRCTFHIATFFTPANPLTGAPAYWTPSLSSPTASGGAICKIVSSDVSSTYTTGAVKAVFSMK